jgi:hypothetical protein
MLAAYRRRHRRTLANAAATVGFPEALERLDRAGTDSLLLGQVSASNPDYVYMVFLTDDPPGVGRVRRHCAPRVIPREARH